MSELEIKKYRKKPVVIEALQLTNNNILDVHIFIFRNNGIALYVGFDNWLKYENNIKQNGLLIPTLEGEIRASIGDYIIKGVKGEFYPCKPDIFKLTYEEATDE